MGAHGWTFALVVCLTTALASTTFESGYYNSYTAVGSQCGRGKAGYYNLGSSPGNLSTDPSGLNCTSGTVCTMFNICGTLKTSQITLSISKLEEDIEGVTYVFLSFNGTYAMKRSPKDLISATLYSSPTNMSDCPPPAPARRVGGWYIPDGYSSGTPMQMALPRGYTYQAQLCITPQPTQGSTVNFDLYDGGIWMFARSVK